MLLPAFKVGRRVRDRNGYVSVIIGRVEVDDDVTLALISEWHGQAGRLSPEFITSFEAERLVLVEEA